ncbi:hypothetical protein [Gemmatimonas sp.]
MTAPPPPPPGGGPPPPQLQPKKNAAPPVVVDKTLFRAVDLQGNDLGAAPFANQGMSVAEFGVRWWFQYFWNEAKMVATQPDREQMAQICNTLFTKRPGQKPAFVCKPEFANDDVSTARPAVWKGILVQLLNIGFRAVERTGAVSTLSGPPVPQVAAHHLMMRADLTHDLGKTLSAESQIFWRAESRTIDRIIQQQGTKRQSDVAFIMKDMQMDAPWHPYADPDINKFMWYRQGQGDNDYYTVISVATNFETALSFPKIDEKRVYGFPKKMLEDWSPDEVRLHRNHMALVTHDDGTEHIMLATQTVAYMCTILGRIIDTQKAGGGFPEKGVSEIPLDQIFGMLPVTRVHHGPDPEDGFTAFIDHEKSRLTSEDWGKSIDLFGGAWEKCKDEFLKQRYRGKVQSAWASNGFKAPDKKVPVSRLLQFPVVGPKLDAFIAARSKGKENPFNFIGNAGPGITNVLKKRP